MGTLNLAAPLVLSYKSRLRVALSFYFLPSHYTTILHSCWRLLLLTYIYICTTLHCSLMKWCKSRKCVTLSGKAGSKCHKVQNRLALVNTLFKHVLVFTRGLFAVKSYPHFIPIFMICILLNKISVIIFRKFVTAMFYKL